MNTKPCYHHDPRTTSSTHAKTPADCPTQHRAAQAEAEVERSEGEGEAQGRPSAQTAGYGSLRQRQHLPPPHEHPATPHTAAA